MDKADKPPVLSVLIIDEKGNEIPLGAACRLDMGSNKVIEGIDDFIPYMKEIALHFQKTARFVDQPWRRLGETPPHTPGEQLK